MAQKRLQMRPRFPGRRISSCPSTTPGFRRGPSWLNGPKAEGAQAGRIGRRREPTTACGRGLRLSAPSMPNESNPPFENEETDHNDT